MFWFYSNTNKIAIFLCLCKLCKLGAPTRIIYLIFKLIALTLIFDFCFLLNTVIWYDFIFEKIKNFTIGWIILKFKNKKKTRLCPNIVSFSLHNFLFEFLPPIISKTWLNLIEKFKILNSWLYVQFIRTNCDNRRSGIFNFFFVIKTLSNSIRDQFKLYFEIKPINTFLNNFNKIERLSVDWLELEKKMINL